MTKKISSFIAGLFLIVGLTQSGYAADSAPDYDNDGTSSNTVNVSDIYSKTLANLMQAAEGMNQSIEQRINKIQIGVDEKTFVSFVLSDTFPDEFTDGEIVGFVDVSGFGDRLPDGQYGVKIYFDEKNLNKPSEFINIETKKQYLFATNTEKVEDIVGIDASEFRIIKGSTCIEVLFYLPDGTAIIYEICID